MKKKIILSLSIVSTAVIVFCYILYMLVLNGVIILNGFSASSYDVKGIDVSSYQGEIDWQTLASENISFAFIKATEGSSYVDKCFVSNFENAQKTDLAVGAYHFFSFDSKGSTQADNFIKTVKPYDGMLTPVIDLEFYGNKESAPPAREDVETELKAMLEALESHYGLKPIIYTTEKVYTLYLSGDYKDYDIWIRNVITKPRISDDRKWTIWQYTNREQLKGYVGKEKYIDMNVFNGTKEEFVAFINENTYKRVG